MAIFKLIPNFEGYFAGDDGMIYSNHPRGVQKGIQPLRKLSQNVQTNGKYYVVSIKKNGDGKYRTQRVHRLVCMAFHGLLIDHNSTVSHLDGNWRNNIPSNLTWESYSDNHNRKKEHGTDDIGIKNSRSSIDLETLTEIRKLLSLGTLTQKDIGAKFGLSRIFITKIKNGHRYKGQGDL